MNAYELADYVDAREIKNLHLKESATMLRQQADQIEQLKKEFDAMVMSFETRLATRGYEIQIKDQADQIVQLEKFIQERGEIGAFIVWRSKELAK